MNKLYIRLTPATLSHIPIISAVTITAISGWNIWHPSIEVIVTATIGGILSGIILWRSTWLETTLTFGDPEAYEPDKSPTEKE